jgi:hypothetical protein
VCERRGQLRHVGARLLQAAVSLHAQAHLHTQLPSPTPRNIQCELSGRP